MAALDEPTRLTTEDSWSDIWEGAAIESAPSLSITKGLGRDLDRILQRHIRPGIHRTCLEVGCYPGRFLRYFHDRFDLALSGLEYVEWCAVRCEELLSQAHCPCTVHHGDLFSWETNERWDVVSSFGLIEHFEDTRDVIENHARLLAPEGLLVITFPRHEGIYGNIMGAIAPDRLAMHNRMSLQRAVDAVESVPGLRLVEACLLGRVGFGASRLHEWLRSHGRLAQTALGIPIRTFEFAGRYLPNSRLFSPHAGILAIKQ